MKYPVKCCICGRSLGECWTPLPYHVCPECASEQAAERRLFEYMREGKE